MAAKLLDIDAIRKTVFVSTGVRVSSSRSPVTPTCASSPSTIMPHAAPGMCSRETNDSKTLSIAPNADESLLTRSASVKRAGSARTAATGACASTCASNGTTLADAKTDAATAADRMQNRVRVFTGTSRESLRKPSRSPADVLRIRRETCTITAQRYLQHSPY